MIFGQSFNPVPPVSIQPNTTIFIQSSSRAPSATVQTNTMIFGRDANPARSVQSEAYSCALVTPLPLHSNGGRPRDLASYFNSAGSKYGGRASDKQSLSRHREMLYAAANVCNLSDSEALKSLFV
eukprot:IDg3065t1